MLIDGKGSRASTTSQEEQQEEVSMGANSWYWNIKCEVGSNDREAPEGLSLDCRVSKLEPLLS